MFVIGRTLINRGLPRMAQSLGRRGKASTFSRVERTAKASVFPMSLLGAATLGATLGNMQEIKVSKYEKERVALQANKVQPVDKSKMTDKDNTVVVITGASGNIGKVLVDHFVQNGWNHVAGIVNSRKIRGHEERSYLTELTSDEAVEKTIQELKEKYPGKQFRIVNCAAWYSTKGLEDPSQDPAYYEEINVRGQERLFAAIDKAGIEVAQFVHMHTMTSKEPSHSKMLTPDSPDRNSEGYGFPYIESKLRQERVISEKCMERQIQLTEFVVPKIFNKDDVSSLATVVMQIEAAESKNPTRHFFPGNPNSGLPYIESHDFAQMVEDTVLYGDQLERKEVFVPPGDTVSQQRLVNSIEDKRVPIIAVPKAISEVGIRMGKIMDNKLGLSLFKGVEPWYTEVGGDNFNVPSGKDNTLIRRFGERHLTTFDATLAELKAKHQG